MLVINNFIENLTKIINNNIILNKINLEVNDQEFNALITLNVSDDITQKSNLI